MLMLGYIFLCLSTPFVPFLKHRSIDNQIAYLSKILDEGYDDALQERFPEGKIFSNAILALATIEHCKSHRLYNEHYASIVDNCIRRIQSDHAKSKFNPSLSLPYGIFYNGWSNFVYKEYKNCRLFRHSGLQKEVVQASIFINQKITQILSDSLRLIDSYEGASWPADNLIGLVSLDDDSTQKKWRAAILSMTLHDSGLIPHKSSDFYTIRGSSSAMITYCLNKSECTDAKDYNKKFQTIFVDEYLGMQLVKENENGSSDMDLDSGPILVGYGASATIMNIKAQASLNPSQSKITWAVMNTIALPINLLGHKYYLFQKEPMLDLFMLWSSTGQ